MVEDIHRSKSEEEYFHRLEAERLAKRREEASKQKNAEERKAHLGRCPACGGHLKAEQYHGVTVDRCADCGGVWFDAGEAESLLDKPPGALAGLLGDLMGAKKRKKG
jgi:uncharacterized protein